MNERPFEQTAGKKFTEYARENGLGAEAVHSFYRVNDFWRANPRLFRQVFSDLMVVVKPTQRRTG